MRGDIERGWGGTHDGIGDSLSLRIDLFAVHRVRIGLVGVYRYAAGLTAALSLLISENSAFSMLLLATAKSVLSGIYEPS